MHKSIVCQRSGYFNQAFNGHFQETSDGKINVHNEDPATLGIVLTFIYSGTYPGPPTSANSASSIKHHAQM